VTNTGTYNNQYMVIDLKKVTLGRELANGTLWVVEQIPGLVVADDLTTILRAGPFLRHQAVAALENFFAVCSRHWRIHRREVISEPNRLS